MDVSDFYFASTLLQGLTFAVLVGTLIFFGLQWAGNRQEAALRMRPYLGFDDVSFKETESEDVIELYAWVLNYGNIPAVNATVYGEFVVGNKENAIFRCETKGAVFPSARERWLIGLKEVEKQAILSGQATLELKLNIEYYSSGGKKYITGTSRTLDYQNLSWMNVECQLT